MIDYILPNGSKVDIDGCVEGILIRTEFPMYFFEFYSALFARSCFKKSFSALR